MEHTQYTLTSQGLCFIEEEGEQKVCEPESVDDYREAVSSGHRSRTVHMNSQVTIDCTRSVYIHPMRPPSSMEMGVSHKSPPHKSS